MCSNMIERFRFSTQHNGGGVLFDHLMCMNIIHFDYE